MRKICACLRLRCCVLGAGERANVADVAVHAGHVLDVKTGKLLADQTLLIEDGKIISTGAAAEAKIPADAVRIDLPNATVLPGLIDAHTHLTMEPKFGYERLAISVPREALIGAKNARADVAGGVHHRAQRGRQRLQRRGVARRHQRRRCARAADAGERAGAQHHGRTLRQQHAALRISRRRAMAWPTASPRCSTRCARTSSTARI